MNLKLVRVGNNDNNFKLSYRSASVTNDREFKNQANPMTGIKATKSRTPLKAATFNSNARQGKC